MKILKKIFPDFWEFLKIFSFWNFLNSFEISENISKNQNFSEITVNVKIYLQKLNFWGWRGPPRTQKATSQEQDPNPYPDHAAARLVEEIALFLLWNAILLKISEYSIIHYPVITLTLT